MLRPILAVALLLAAPLSAQSQMRLPAWMAGTWSMQDGAEWHDEIWTDPRGGLMLGLERSGFGLELTHWELMQIRQGADGRIAFVAQPPGGPRVEFPMVLASEEAVEFANPSNSYPQRIRYWRQGKLLMIEISRIDGSDARRWNCRPVIPPQDD